MTKVLLLLSCLLLGHFQAAVAGAAPSARELVSPRERHGAHGKKGPGTCPKDPGDFTTQEVAQWIDGLQLSQHSADFADALVDGARMSELDKGGLKEMGVTSAVARAAMVGKWDVLQKDFQKCVGGERLPAATAAFGPVVLWEGVVRPPSGSMIGSTWSKTMSKHGGTLCNDGKRGVLFLLQAKVGTTSLKKVVEQSELCEFLFLRHADFSRDQQRAKNFITDRVEVVIFTREPLDKFRSAVDELWARINTWKLTLRKSPIIFKETLPLAEVLMLSEVASGFFRAVLEKVLYRPDWDVHLAQQYSAEVLRLVDDSNDGSGYPVRLYRLSQMNQVLARFGIISEAHENQRNGVRHDGTSNFSMLCNTTAVARRVICTYFSRWEEKCKPLEISWEDRRSAVTELFGKSEVISPDLQRLLDSDVKTGLEPVTMGAFADLVVGQLNEKLNSYASNCDPAGKFDRHRPLAEDEEWALCCVYWNDYDLGGHSMPASCAVLRSQQAVCKAACKSFGVLDSGTMNTPPPWDPKNRTKGIQFRPFCWAVQ